MSVISASPAAVPDRVATRPETRELAALLHRVFLPSPCECTHNSFLHKPTRDVLLPETLRRDANVDLLAGNSPF